MSEKTGTTITCDRLDGRSYCRNSAFGKTPGKARELATLQGFTRTEDGRDFCARCTEIRANRKKPSDLAPEGLRLMEVFAAAEAVGWERRDYDAAEGTAHFYCCEQEVNVHSVIGMPYHAECKTCGSAIADILHPQFGNSYVSFVDTDKVDAEEPVRWFNVAEYRALQPEPAA